MYEEINNSKVIYDKEKIKIKKVNINSKYNWYELYHNDFKIGDKITESILDLSESNIINLIDITRKKYAWFLYVLNAEFRKQFLIDLEESEESGVDFINGEILRYKKLSSFKEDEREIFDGRRKPTFYFKYYQTSRYLFFLDVMKFFYDKYGKFSYKYTGI